MLRVTLANVRGHVVRLLLTCLAVTLGTAFVAGSFVLTDSIDRTFSAIFATADSTDAVVRLEGAGPSGDAAATAEGAGAGTGAQAGPDEVASLPGLPLELADDIEAVDGVERAVPALTGSAVLRGADGTAVRSGGAPALGFAWDPLDPSVRLLDGRGAESPDEVVVETTTLEQSGLALGDETVVVVNGTPFDVTVVGEATNDTPTAGAAIVLVEQDLAREQFAPTGVVPSITVTAVDGLTQEEVVDRVAPLVPDGAEVVTGQQQADETQETLATALGFITTFLLVFAGVALFVGAFIIFNTFSMLVAQRTRELALLRAIGASRGQVVRSVLGESVVVGLVGSLAGLGIGIGLAAALQQLIGGLFGLELERLPVEPRTVVATLVLGVAVTALAAVLPARRASATAPVAAMRDEQALPRGAVRLRAVLGLAVAAVGAVAMALVLTDTVDTQPLAVLGAGVTAVFLGVAAASPAVSKPVVWLVTAPFAGRAVGRLAQRNGLRNPRRTAATASALMVGLALVGAASVLSSSAAASVSDIIDDEFTGDLVVSDGGQPSIPATVADAVRDVDGVEAVLELPFTAATVDGEDGFGMAVDPATLPGLVELTTVEGSLDALGDGVWLTESRADELGAAVGDTVTVAVGNGAAAEREVLAVYEDSQLVAADVLVSDDVYAAGVDGVQAGGPGGGGGVQYVLVDVADDADLAAVEAAVADVAADFLTLSVLDADEFTSEQTAQITTVLGLIYALLGLSLVIATLGVINTLALSVVERTREIGLLRAIGLTRAQLRRTVTIESVATTVFGALLGVALGLAFGVAFQRAVADDGLEVLAVPWATMTVVLVGSAVVGVVAALLPAWRATRVDVLRAITTE
ncbi:ABC transporter permease [Aquipuribacter nitratireducens]|uniref:ABC transporter permease n=1 Tax=Aquipuribacter nitratireducens TaxID=650104 RepID=A0ABW0GIH1_9MICO